MLTKLSELEKLLSHQVAKKQLVLAAANEPNALDAAYKAWQKGYVEVVLVGDADDIKKIAQREGYDLSSFQIIDETNVQEAVQVAVQMVHNGQADILMKGNVSTSTLMKGVLNKEWGLRAGSLISHLAIFEIPAYHKLVALTDAAMNIAPDLAAKTDIIKNAVSFLHHIGVKKPKVAVLGAVETVSADMPATLDAAALSKMSQRGQIQGCIIDGPLAFDNAISKESAHHKNITSEVAGDADLLVAPNIEAANVLYKSFAYFANAKLAAVILGASAPIVLTSRADSEESKLNSILLAALA